MTSEQTLITELNSPKLNSDKLNEAIITLLKKVKIFVLRNQYSYIRGSYWFDICSNGTKLINLLRNLYQACPSKYERNDLILDIIELIIFPKEYSMCPNTNKRPMFFDLRCDRQGDLFKVPAKEYKKFRTSIAHTY